MGMLALLCVASAATPAQQRDTAAPSSGHAPGGEAATTLDTVRVTAPRPEILDLYRFRNPIAPQPTIFDHDMHPPPSLEEIGENGGVIPLLVGYLAQKITIGARKIPGWKDYEQPAIARPPPLTEEQMLRAIRLQERPRQP